MSARAVVLFFLAFAVATPTLAQGNPGTGKVVYDSACAACHNSGAAGAPKLGDASAWQPRFARGIGDLYRSALSGKGSMPAKGGQARLTNAEIEAAVNYMVLAADANAKVPVVAARVDAKAAPAAAKAAPAPATAAAAGAPAAAQQDAGAAVYARACAACHASGAAGAPKFGDAAAWAPKVKAGLAALQSNAIAGKGAMPAKGGNASLSDADVRAAVAYMVERSAGGRAGDAATAASRSGPGGASATAAASAASAAPAVTVAAAAPSAAAPAAPSVAVPARAVDSSPNNFNRLLRSANRRNPPPHEDGIHDPSIEEVYLLQPPLTGLAGLPPSTAGNRVDWVKSLNEGKIAPRFDRTDPQVQAAVMDLNIVREVKGSMPDVVYPHKQHTQWLDCSNCHPAIFKPQKGANAMSMAAIMVGEQCGVCHGKVAFPLSECRLCHSKSKVAGATPAAPR